MAPTRRDMCLGLVSGALSACREGTKTGAGAAPTFNAPSVDPTVATPHVAQSPAARAAASGVPKRSLGKTGVEVSMLGLGGAHIGKGLSEGESITLMRAAIDNGITFMDNCWDYNDGASEERMGKALRDGYRARVFLMTKLDGRTKKSALAQLEQSLKRLQTETIDLVQIHEIIRSNDPARCFAPQGAMEALSEAKQAGKLRFVGFTGHKHPDIHLAMLDAAQKAGFALDTVQLPLNVMDAHYQSFEQKVLPVLLERGIGVLGMKSMGAGDILKSGVVTAEECLRYALSLPTSVVITGIDKKEVLEQDLKLARNFTPLSAAERKSLLARTEKHAQAGKFELFKTADKYDGTAKNPHWLEKAEL